MYYMRIFLEIQAHIHATHTELLQNKGIKIIGQEFGKSCQCSVSTLSIDNQTHKRR